MIEKGHKEIVLTGVDIASWGHDLDKKSNLGFLVKKILQGSPDLTRLKLSSMDVIGFDDELLEIIATEERILPHIHLSLIKKLFFTEVGQLAQTLPISHLIFTIFYLFFSK